MAFDGRGGPSALTSRLASSGATSATPHPRRLHPSSPPEPQVSAISTLLSKESAANSNNLEYSNAQTYARRELLGGGSFGTLGNSTAPEETPEDMQKKDPLATQVWKLYSKQKGTLPNAERMENLTWRMMALTLRRERYVFDVEALCGTTALRIRSVMVAGSRGRWTTSRCRHIHRNIERFHFLTP